MSVNGYIFRGPIEGDAEKLELLDREAWGDDEMSASRSKWDSRMSIFPDGMFVAELHGRVVGVISTLLLKWDYPLGYFPTWAEATDDGFIKNHDPGGDVLYGVDITSLPDMAGLAEALLRLEMNLAREKKLLARVGIRIPTLQEKAVLSGVADPDTSFVRRAAAKDWLVRFFLTCGFKNAGFRADYFPPDKESLGWGAIMEY